jgi:hypothetical protein
MARDKQSEQIKGLRGQLYGDRLFRYPSLNRLQEKRPKSIRRRCLLLHVVDQQFFKDSLRSF